MYFCPYLWAPKKNFRLVTYAEIAPITYPEIAPREACLTIEFFAIGLQKKKVYLANMSILLILLSIESGCHNPPLRRPTSSSINTKPGTYPFSHVRTSSTGIHIPYVQLAADVPYRVPPREPTRYTYIPTSLTHMLLYHSQLIHMRPWNCEGQLR
jgi:hypothetical protein